MPITFLFSCCAFLGLLLLVPAVLAAVVLLSDGRKRAALKVLCVPVGMIVLSILLTFLVFAVAERHSRIMSSHPDHLFHVTFGLWPLPATSVLEAYHDSVMDYGTTVLKFQTTRETINQITGRNFPRCDKEAFLRAYDSNAHNLPESVRSWFLPAAREADEFYITARFERSYGSSDAVLCYNSKTQIACFHWVGVD